VLEEGISQGLAVLAPHQLVGRAVGDVEAGGEDDGVGWPLHPVVVDEAGGGDGGHPPVITSAFSAASAG